MKRPFTGGTFREERVRNCCATLITRTACIDSWRNSPEAAAFGTWASRSLIPHRGPQGTSRLAGVGARYSPTRSDGHFSAFFLEYERSAIYKSKIPDKLDSYLAYYSTAKPLEEYGVMPMVLFVFETAFHAKRFTDVARGEFEKTGARLPLWVTSEEELYEEGPFSPVWRSPYGNRLESPLQAALFP